MDHVTRATPLSEAISRPKVIVTEWTTTIFPGHSLKNWYCPEKSERVVFLFDFKCTGLFKILTYALIPISSRLQIIETVLYVC